MIMDVKINELSKSALVMLVSRIAEELQASEDAEGFCLWLSDVLNKTTGSSIDFKDNGR